MIFDFAFIIHNFEIEPEQKVLRPKKHHNSIEILKNNLKNKINRILPTHGACGMGCPINWNYFIFNWRLITQPIVGTTCLQWYDYFKKLLFPDKFQTSYSIIIFSSFEFNWNFYLMFLNSTGLCRVLFVKFETAPFSCKLEIVSFFRLILKPHRFC